MSCMFHLSICVASASSSDCTICFRMNIWSLFWNMLFCPNLTLLMKKYPNSLDESPRLPGAWGRAGLDRRIPMTEGKDEVSLVNTGLQGNTQHGCHMKYTISFLPLLNRITIINDTVIASDTIFLSRFNFKYSIISIKVFYVWNKSCT